jgi:hypothetical protein
MQRRPASEGGPYTYRQVAGVTRRELFLLAASSLVLADCGLFHLGQTPAVKVRTLEKPRRS